MSTVSIKSFADIGDPNAPVGSPEWCKAAHLNLKIHKHNAEHEMSSLKFGLLEFRDSERWRQLVDRNGRPFRTWRDYVEAPEPYGLGFLAHTIDRLLETPSPARQSVLDTLFCGW